MRRLAVPSLLVSLARPGADLAEAEDLPADLPAAGLVLPEAGLAGAGFAFAAADLAAAGLAFAGAGLLAAGLVLAGVGFGLAALVFLAAAGGDDFDEADPDEGDSMASISRVGWWWGSGGGGEVRSGRIENSWSGRAVESVFGAEGKDILDLKVEAGVPGCGDNSPIIEPPREHVGRGNYD